jgi:hypothetical protein
MDPVTLADVRKLIGHLPKEARAKSTRRHVEAVPPGSRYATDSVPPDRCGLDSARDMYARDMIDSGVEPAKK